MKPPLITILTAPKPFMEPHIQVIQKNALRSWKALGDQVEVIVLGNDQGIAENTRLLDIRHCPDVRCNEKGTPLISSMLEIGRNESTSPNLAIVNSDIILFPDFIQAVKNVVKREKEFLIIGQRWDMEINNEVGELPSDYLRLKKRVVHEAQLHPPRGSDYFIFPRTCYQEIPDFTIGRAGWDNWFIYMSRWEGWTVIDGTQDVVVVHQTHDYAHLPNGMPHYRLPETRHNITLGGGEHTIFSLLDAQYDLKKSTLEKKKWSWRKIFREIEIFPLSNKRSQFLGRLSFYSFHPKKGFAGVKRALRKAFNIRS